jgi:hypothetical protein
MYEVPSSRPLPSRAALPPRRWVVWAAVSGIASGMVFVTAGLTAFALVSRANLDPSGLPLTAFATLFLGGLTTIQWLTLRRWSNPSAVWIPAQLLPGLLFGLLVRYAAAPVAPLTTLLLATGIQYALLRGHIRYALLWVTLGAGAALLGVAAGFAVLGSLSLVSG